MVCVEVMRFIVYLDQVAMCPSQSISKPVAAQGRATQNAGKLCPTWRIIWLHVIQQLESVQMFNKTLYASIKTSIV